MTQQEEMELLLSTPQRYTGYHKVTPRSTSVGLHEQLDHRFAPYERRDILTGKKEYGASCTCGWIHRESLTNKKIWQLTKKTAHNAWQRNHMREDQKQDPLF